MGLVERFRLGLGRSLIVLAGRLMLPYSGDWLGSSESLKGAKKRIWWSIGTQRNVV